MSRLICLFVIFFAAVCCAGDEASISAEITPIPTSTVLPPTATHTPKPTQTNTPDPTKTPRPTWTVIPTNTPKPTTMIATATSEILPTATASPDVATPVVETMITLTPTQNSIAAPNSSPVPATPTASVTIENTPTPSVTPTATQPPTAVPPPSINGLGDLPDGTEVTITGNVVNTASFSQGFKFTVADATGRITLLLWHNVYDDCWDCGGLNIGATVVATGEIGRFEGELQVVPNWGGGVQVSNPAYAWAQPQPVNNLANVKGQRAMVEGTVTDTFSNEQFTKLQVSDGTGTVEIFMWKNVWDRVSIRGQLTTGAHVKVIGIVGEFNGTIQVQPMLPVDVLQ